MDQRRDQEERSQEHERDDDEPDRTPGTDGDQRDPGCDNADEIAGAEEGRVDLGLDRPRVVGFGLRRREVQEDAVNDRQDGRDTDPQARFA
jgi:hypothetical protein